MVWYGMVWYGMVWYGMVWYGMVWYGMVWYGMVYGMVWYGMVWCVCMCVCQHHNLKISNVSRGNFFLCRVFAMKSVQNQKLFWRIPLKIALF
jgi:hypothetical protein